MGTQAEKQASSRAGNRANDAPNHIDVHHHILPPKYVSKTRDRILEVTGGDFDIDGWSPSRSLEQMDQYGISTAITSLPLPSVWFGDTETNRELARIGNEYAAQLAHDHPGRFGVFAAIPLPDRDGSLREIEYALDTLKADGITILTSYGDRWAGDAAHRPVFEELNRRQAVVFVHPTAPDCCKSLIPDVPRHVVEFLFDTTRAIVSLLASGTLSSFPDIRFLFCHCGGTMPMLAHRIHGTFRARKELAERVPNGALSEFKRLYYDIANNANPSSLSAITRLVPMTQLLFGSDYPYRQIAPTVEGFTSFGFTEDEMRAISRENALRLFPSLAANRLSAGM